MLRTFLAGIVVVSLVSSAPGPEAKVPLPKGRAPRFFIVTGLDKDQVELTEGGPGTSAGADFTKYKPAFKDLQISDASGKKLSAEDFADRVKLGTVVVVAADGNKVDPAYLSLLKGDAVILGGVVPMTQVSQEIKYEMDDIEKNFGAKFKAVKLEQKKPGGDTLVTITLEFTKDLPERGGISMPGDLMTFRNLFTGKPTLGSSRAGNTQLQCCFFDEDGVVFTRQPPGKIDGAVSGKDGDAFRITQSVPGDVWAKTKKISFREEPAKK